MRKINVNEREDKYTCVAKDDKEFLIPPTPPLPRIIQTNQQQQTNQTLCSLQTVV